MKWLWLLLYVIAGAAVFFISTSTAVVYLLRDESTVACPDLTGIDAEEARSVAAQKGLSLVVASYEKKKDIPYNQVLSQTPEPAMPVKSGRTVSVVVSDGPKAVNIDSYLGLSLEEAQAALQERKIGINKIIYVPSETVGKILAQMPAAGQNILDEKGISFIVGGREKRFFVMPEIASGDYTAAIEEMDQKQIKYSVTSGGPLGGNRRTTSTNIPPGSVFSDEQVLEIRTGIGG